MAYLYYKSLNQHRLGNSLFMIAATIGVAKQKGMQPLFPADWKYRKYFNIPDEYFGDCKAQHNYIEQAFTYESNITIQPENTYFSGYFQSEKYFAHCADEIRKYLTPKDVIPGSIDAVSIHHRRGDYVGNPNYQQLGMGYYISAYDTFFKGKEIRAFSDDCNYIDLHYGGNTVTAKPVPEIEDFSNMVRCKYHICSNSTFSWWAAWLSGSTDIIHPKKYFDGPLAERCKEYDLWPDMWTTYSEVHPRYSLNDVTFIIPFSYDHPDRLQNIEPVIKFLNTHFHCSIYVGEINSDKMQKPGHYYTHYEMPVFHRTKVLNDMTIKALTPIVFNWDADVITSPWQIYAAVERLRNGVDICYPFSGNVANIPRNNLQPFFESLDPGVFSGKMWPWQNTAYKSVGMAVGYNKESFLNAGGEHEGFISYGAEDQYRYMHFKRIGLKVERIPGVVFHMNHWRGNDSCERHPNNNNNRLLFEAELELYREWCKQTDDKDTWRPFQSSTGKICVW